MPSKRSIDARILALAALNLGLVHDDDLRAAQVNRSAVYERTRNGWMAPVIPRIHAVGPTCASPTWQVRCKAATMARRGRAWLDGLTAARVVMQWDRHHDADIQVTVAGSVPNARLEGYRFHRRGALWLPHAPLAVDSLDTVGFLDMALRLGQELTPWQLAHVIDRGRYRRLVTLDELEAFLGSIAPAPGSAALARALALLRSRSVGTRAESEDRLLGDVLLRGVPEPLVNVRGACGLPHDEPDLFWRDVPLNVEVDGRHHDDEAQQADDRARDALVESRGIPVIRLPARWLWGHRRRRAVDVVVRAVGGETVRVDPVTRRPAL